MINNLIATYSKSAPFAFQYDDSGKPFSRLVSQVGCPLGPSSVACLQKVPFDVCNIFHLSVCLALTFDLMVRLC